MLINKSFKSLLAVFVIGTSLACCASAMAGSTTSSKEEPDKITLYASDNEKQTIRTLPPTAPLIEIYKKNGWIKVGDPKDGTVGWINQKQYQKTMDHFNTPNIQEIFVSRSRDENGKPEIRVVAYQNGAPVSDEKARAIYEKVKKQQELQEQYWRDFNKDITHWQKTMLNKFYHDEFLNQLIWMPAPIVVAEKENGKSK